MAEVERDREMDELLRAMLLAAAQKLRAAVELIEAGGHPADADAVCDAGVLCADAGTLLESVSDLRLDSQGEGGRGGRGTDR